MGREKKFLVVTYNMGSNKYHYEPRESISDAEQYAIANSTPFNKASIYKLIGTTDVVIKKDSTND